jgi:protein involved in temperature-dependent protein secretion
MTDKFGYSVSLSQRVDELLREGTIEEILQLVKEEIEGEWVSTLPSDSTLREELYFELHALNRVQLRLSSIINSIRMSESQWTTQS